MSTPEISQVLAQMRVMAARAEGVEPPPQASGAGFGELLKDSIDAVNQTQQTAGDLKTAFEVGEPGVDLASVMIASQKANLAFQATVQVRNRLVEAYKDVMSMPI